MNFKNSMILIALLLLVSVGQSRAAEYEFDPNSIPNKMGVSSAGTEFWITFHTGTLVPQHDNDSRIYIVSEFQTEVTISIEAEKYSNTVTVMPNEITEVIFPEGQGIANLKSRHEPLNIEKAFGRGIHVESEKPIIVYGMMRFYAKSDGYLAMPVSTLGQKYQASTFLDYSDNTSTFMPPYITIVAAYDDTQVTVQIGGVPGTVTGSGKLPGESDKFTIHAGDVVIISTENRLSDLSGTIVESNKPVAVFSGNMDAEVPVGDCCGDYLIEMMSPVDTWGKQYFVIPFKDEEQNSIINIFASEPNTSVMVAGEEVALIEQDGGDSVDFAWSRLLYLTEEPEPFLIYSDKPIAISQFNYSLQHGEEDGYSPFLMNLTPLEHFSNSLEFSINGNPDKSDNFTVNMLQFVYPGTHDGRIPETITMTYMYKGEWTTRPLNAIAPQFGTPLPTKINNKTYYYLEIPFKDYGFYIIESLEPITGSLWGYNSNSSYGTQSWKSVAVLYSGDNDAPVANFTQQNNGNVENGEFVDMPANAEIRTNINMVYFNQDESFNFDLTIEEFIVGFPLPIEWNLQVIDKFKNARAVFNLSDRAGNDTTIVIEYYADLLHLDPNDFDFELVKLGEAVSHDFTLFNDSEDEDLIINDLKFQNDDQGFEVTDVNNDPITFPLPGISPQGSHVFRVRQLADELGEKEDSLIVVSQKLSQTALRVQALVSSPIIETSDIDYNEVVIGIDRINKMVLHNAGLYPVTITGFDGPTNPEIFVVEDHGITPDNPFELKPNKYKNIFITFKPGSKMKYIDSLEVISNTQGGDPVCQLTGTGITSVMDRIDDGIITIYPNPSDGVINISSNDQSYRLSSIWITDLQGKSIYSLENINQSSKEINLSNIVSGTYIIEIKTNKGTMTSKLTLTK
jgi:IgGFc binding protein/Secretion system C-terminal sorting domain